MSKDIFVRSPSDIEQMQIAYNDGVAGTAGVPIQFTLDHERPIYNAMYQHGANYAQLKRTITSLEDDLVVANHDLQNTKACLHARNGRVQCLEVELAEVTKERDELTSIMKTPAAPMPPCIILDAAEIQSGLSRVKRAEGLIEQLPPDHDGRNSWLLNYGTGAAAQRIKLLDKARREQLNKGSIVVTNAIPGSAYDIEQRPFKDSIKSVGVNAAGDILPPRNPTFGCAGVFIEGSPYIAVDIDTPRKHNHYYREMPFANIDVYRILHTFEVTDPCAQHAIKKLLAMGKRGHKDAEKDVQDVIDTMTRWQEMRAEEGKVSE